MIKSYLFRFITVTFAILFALILFEIALRVVLFHTSLQVPLLKSPSYYAKDEEEYWIFQGIFSKTWRVEPSSSPQSVSGEFYDHWGASLIFDPELGYVRKPDVKIPCHETTNFATRGLHDYAVNGKKVLFFGDSFTETNACSGESLSPKMEKLLNTDVLNFGIGGYGFDQIYLYLRRLAPQFKAEDSLFLVGIIPEDMSRMLLKVRTSPKPYFTIKNNALQLHTDHINLTTFNDWYTAPFFRSYLYYLIRAKTGQRVLDADIELNAPARWRQVDELTYLILDEYKKLETESSIKVTFVIFPYLSHTLSHRQKIAQQIESKGLKAIDLDACFDKEVKSGAHTQDDLFDKTTHPTSLGNDLIATCLAKEINF